LLNLCILAERVKAATGVQARVVGFDTGQGMPPPVDWRDHPERFGAGDFQMDQALLTARLPPTCRLILGPVAETVPEFVQTGLTPAAPLGFVAFDLDYYSSTKQAVPLLTDLDAAKYLFLPVLYFDDIVLPYYSDWGGELLAINEFKRGTTDAQDSALSFPAFASLFEKRALD
jgi:hypothetical protein